jgi:uncharacterized protein (DUF58 family)
MSETRIQTLNSRITRLCVVLVGVILVLSTLIAVLALRFGSLSAAVAYMSGERLLVTPQTLELEALREDERREVRFELTNLSDRVARIQGASTSCGCILVKQAFPFDLAPGECRPLTLTVHSAGNTDELHHSLTLYSDLDGAGVVTSWIHGRIERNTAVGD